jgi:DNA replication and repair protein RecF
LIVKSLSLSQFRNYTSLQIQFHPGINLILGENAQGKTNLLEALYICAALRSFRTRKDSDLIRFSESFAYLKMEIESIYDAQPEKHVMEMVFQKDQKKRVKRNGLSQTRISDVMGTFKAVLFSPEDLKIVKDSPAERRQFMDSEMIQVSPRYYHTLSQYQKIIKQRNQLLKTRNLSEAELSVWDEQLAISGTQLMLQRSQFMTEIGSIAEVIHRQLTDHKETLQIGYEPGIALPSAWEEWSTRKLSDHFMVVLARYRQTDLMRQTTHKGPHRDDVHFSINQMDVRQYGSQGQKRTVVLSLKLAVLEWMKEQSGEYPVLLLDDVTSELDDQRQKELLNYLKPVQTIITSTHTLPNIPGDSDRGCVFRIHEGKLTNG